MTISAGDGDVLMKNARVWVDSEAAASIHENGIVILHVGKGRVYAANETGARIWRGIVQEQSLNTIATKISDEYQIPITEAYEHVSAFISDLERHSLVQQENL
jgi:Coenzyme PQQ synthesis protein D (PqqD)